MSNQTYTMKLIVDDSAVKKLEERIAGIMGVGGSSGSSSKSSGSSLFGGSGGGDSPFKQLGKLGAIAAGIALLVTAVKKIVEKVVESSPALQAMFKILDASVTLILRPIGDFFAYLLKPILIIFLRKVALPFFKLVDPLMKYLGAGIGGAAASNLEGNFGMVWDFLNGDWEALDARFNDLRGWWLEVEKWFGGLKLPDLTESWDAIVGFFKTLFVPPWMIVAWDTITDFFDDLVVPDWLKLTWENVTNFFKLLVVPPWMLLAWDHITNFIDTLKVPEWMTLSWDGVTKFMALLVVPPWMTMIWYNLTSFLSTLKVPDVISNAVESFFEFLKKIGEWIAGLPDFLADLLGFNNKSGGSSDSGSRRGTPPALEINVNQIGDQIGQAGEDIKEQVLSWFNEWFR